jgi:succinate dehydrogenase / fumarate reductase flavoprotein subunit
LVTGEIEKYAAHAVVIATGGYGNVFFLSTNAMSCSGSAAWQCYKRGAIFGNPCYVQIHPTCIPVHGDFQSKLTLMSESLRNDGRIWVPAKKEDAEAIRAEKLKPTQIAEEDRDYFLERRYPAFGNLVPRDVASRAAKERCDAGFGVGETGLAVYLDFADAIQRLGKHVIEERYGNLFQMYEKIVDDNPYQTPMMIYPAIHYSMGGIWVDYELQTTIPGLFAAGEANFSDHGANRLGASALMQGLAEAIEEIKAVRKEFWQDVRVTGETNEFNPELEKALRTADHLELGELMARDALLREESCGGHFREEHQTPDGEALRHDDEFMYVSCWEYTGEDKEPIKHKEMLNYEEIKVAQRNYK